MSVITLGRFNNRNKDLLDKLTSLDYVKKVEDRDNAYSINYSKIDDKMWNDYRDYVYLRGVRSIVNGETVRRDLTPEERRKLPFHYFTVGKDVESVVFARNYDNGQCEVFADFLSKAVPDEVIRYDIRTEGHIDGVGSLKDGKLCDSKGVPTVGRLDGFSKCEYLAHAISSIYKDEELNVVIYNNGECKFDGYYKNGDVSKTNFSKNRKVLPDISHITDNFNKTTETDFEL